MRRGLRLRSNLHAPAFEDEVSDPRSFYLEPFDFQIGLPEQSPWDALPFGPYHSPDADEPSDLPPSTRAERVITPRRKETSKSNSVENKEVVSSAHEDPYRQRSLNEYDGGPPREEVALAKGDFKIVHNPALAGVNEQVRARIAAGHSAMKIASYLDQVEPGLGRELASKLGATIAFRTANPRVPMNNYRIDLENIQVPMGTFEKGLNAVAQSAPGAYVIAAGDAASLGLMDNFADDPERVRLGMSLLAEERPISTFAGNIHGSGLASNAIGRGLLGLGMRRGAPLLGDFLSGIGYGAGSNDEDRLAGAVEGGLSASVAAGVGRKIGVGLGYAYRGGRTPEGYAAHHNAIERQAQIDKQLAQGFTQSQAEYLAQPYDKMGHHFWPRNGEIGIINTAVHLPKWASDSPLNVLKPRGISIGDFYERHYKVDRDFYGAKLPKHAGGGIWSGKALGLEKYKVPGKIWYGSPTELKMAGGALLGSGVSLPYLLRRDEEE